MIHRTSKSSTALDALVKQGDIKSYEFLQVKDEDGSDEKLVLEFPSGNKLTVETFCPNEWQKTFLYMSVSTNECQMG